MSRCGCPRGKRCRCGRNAKHRKAHRRYPDKMLREGDYEDKERRPRREAHEVWR